MAKQLQQIVDQSITESTGFVAKEEEFDINALGWLTRSNEIIPPWWSRARDRKLTSFWKESNHLSLAAYSAQS